MDRVDLIFKYFQYLAGCSLFGGLIDGAIFGSQTELYGIVAGLFIGMLARLEDIGAIISKN